METLRQMVAADVGITLMPMLSVKPPIAATGNVVIRHFENPAPSRVIALVWRGSSALSGFLIRVSPGNHYLMAAGGVAQKCPAEQDLDTSAYASNCGFSRD